MDTTAALLHDTEPLFPLPVLRADNNIAGWTTLPNPLLHIACNNCIYSQRLLSIVVCIGELNAVATITRNDAANSDSVIWNEEEETSFSINRLTHHLLQTRPLSASVTASDTIAEALRLGALIFIIHIKRKCRSYPSDAEEQISKLLKMLANETFMDGMSIWGNHDLRLVRIWLFVLCSVCEPNSTDMAIAMEMLHSDFAGMEHTSWTETTMAEIRQMPWLDSFEPLLAKLEHRLFENHLASHPLADIDLDE